MQEDTEEQAEDEELQELPREFLFSPEAEAAMDPNTLGGFKALLGQKGGPAGRVRKSVVYSLERGRCVRRRLVSLDHAGCPEGKRTRRLCRRVC